MDYLPSNSSTTLMEASKELVINRQTRIISELMAFEQVPVENRMASVYPGRKPRAQETCSSSQKLRHKGFGFCIQWQHPTEHQVMPSPSLIQNTQTLCLDCLTEELRHPKSKPGYSTTATDFFPLEERNFLQ